VVTAGAVVAAIGATAYWSGNSPSQARNLVTAEAARGPFTAKLSETGELRALESVTVSAEKDLPVINLVPEGTFVKEGDELVRFDATKYEVVLEESQAALQVAEAELRKVRQDLEAQRQRLLAEISRFEAEVVLARLDLENLKKKPLKEEREAAQLEVEKARAILESADRKRIVLPELVAKGFVTKSSLDEAEVKYLEARVALQAAEFTLARVAAGATPEELEKATVRLEQAKVGLERAQSGTKSQLQAFEAGIDREKANVSKAKALISKAQEKLGRAELRAPREGLVVYASAKPGERSTEKVQLGMIPFQGQPLIYLPDISTMVADTEINEIDIGKVQLGGIAEVRLEAYPGTVFPGTILKIGSLAKLKQSRAAGAAGVKVFDVTVKIESKDARLKPGLSATVDIIIDRRDDVVSVPLAAVIARRGAHYVLVSGGGGTLEERKVVLGASNNQRVVVTHGLSGGEQLVLGAPPAGSS
jgi:HlyD family secretion protein